jgi:hypothetical protein
MSRTLLIFAAFLTSCAANNFGTGPLELEESEPTDAGRRDASTRADASVRRDASTRTDASVVKKGCEGDAPHGCYTLTDDSPEGCPDKSPEIPLGLPAFTEWDLCNGGAVTAGQTCVWEGPDGATANCLCDTGVHWLCLYL